MVYDRNPAAGDTPGIPVSSVIRTAVRRFLQFFRGTGHTSPEELLHAARVLLWVRWLGLIAALIEIHYRVDHGSLSHILNTFYCLGFLAINGYVQWLIRRRGTVKPSWLLGLSVLDPAAMSFSASISGGLNGPYFPAYYFAVAVSAYVFTCTPAGPALDHPGGSRLLGAELCRGAGSGPGRQGGAASLLPVVVALYAVSAAVSIIAGLERERELQRHSMELSQTIHDTTVQRAW